MPSTDIVPDFSRCHLKGLPIGIPFKSKYTIQQMEIESTKAKDTDVDVFIILPLTFSDILKTVQSEIMNLESDENNLQQELINKLMFTDWSFTPAGGCYWNAQKGHLSSAEPLASTGSDEPLTEIDNNAVKPKHGIIEQYSQINANASSKLQSCQCVKGGKRLNKRKHNDCSCIEKFCQDTGVKIARTSYDETIGQPNTRRRAKGDMQVPKCETDKSQSRKKGVQPELCRALEEASDSYWLVENPDAAIVVKMNLDEDEELNNDLNEESDTSASMDQHLDIEYHLDTDNEANMDNNLENNGLRSPIDDVANMDQSLDTSNKIKPCDDRNQASKKSFKPKKSTNVSKTCTKKKINTDSDLDLTDVLNIEPEQAGEGVLDDKDKAMRNIKSKTCKSKIHGRRQTLKKLRLCKTRASLSSTNQLTKKNVNIKARQHKQKEKDEKLNRIKVKLEDHTDKYRVDVLGSFSRKDRGKAKEDCETEFFLCTVCDNFRSENKDVMESHIECHVNGELNCNQCDFVGVSVLVLRKHQREKHRQNVLICSECGAETTGQDGLKDHMGKVHGQPQYPCKLCLSEKGEKFACETKVSFRQHLRKEHPDKMVSCKACNRLYKNEYQLRKHQESSNCQGDGKKEYPCEVCGKTYSTFRKVQLHITRVHNKVKTFKCELCPFVTGRKHGLRDHMYTHTGNHPFKCDQCTFSCVRASQLVSHRRTHTGEKPYKCGTCNYAAAWNVQLRDHLKVHTLPSCVECQKCRVAFKDGHALYSHDVREHPISRQEGLLKQ